MSIPTPYILHTPGAVRRRRHASKVPTFSGMTLETTFRNESCPHCNTSISFGFVFSRYRGSKYGAAAKLLYYHKDCLIQLLATTKCEISTRSTCLICKKKETDWKFVIPNSNQDHGGYHKSCILSFIASYAYYDDFETKLKNGSLSIKELNKELQVENQIINKGW